MSFANFGVGIGALAQGLNQGVQTGAMLRQVSDQNQIRRATKQGMSNAESSRSSAIDSLVQTGSASNADNTMTVPTYQVGDQKFSNQEDARKTAESQVGSVMDFFYQNEAPRIAELYLQQGDVQKAEIWNKWIKDKNVQKGFEYGVKAYQAATIGDDEGAVKSMIKMYNHPGYFEDGRKATGYKPIKGDDGSVTGYAITIKDANGNEQILNVNKGQEMLQAIAPFVDPRSIYEQGLREIETMRLAQEKTNDRLWEAEKIQFQEDGRNQRHRETIEGQNQRLVTGKELDAANKRAELEMRAQVDLLYKKNTHPDEAVKQIVLASKREQAQNPYGPQRSDRELVAEARKLVAEIYQGQQKNPMSGGIQPQQAPRQAPTGRGPIIFDTQTGKVVPYGR